MEEERRRALQKYNTWQGTKAYMRDGADRETRADYDSVAHIFEGDPPAPEARLNEFTDFLGASPEYKVVEWRVGIVSIVPNNNGWKATVRVNPTLAALTGGIPFTPHETVETWQIDANGNAAVLDVRSGDNWRGLLIVD